jgi:hypothetical protein
MKRQKYFTLFLLVAATVVLGMMVPQYMNNQVDRLDSFFFTPRPTSTLFSASISDVMDVLQFAPASEAADLGNSMDGNCTYPVYYWQNHPDSWPPELVIGGVTYTKDNVRTLYAGVTVDIPTRLTRQIYSAVLNILHGASMNVIEEAISEAVSWLDANPAGSELSEFNRQQGRYLADLIESYNNGVIGPGICKDAPATPTTSPTATPSWTAGPPTETSTATSLVSNPFGTRTPTQLPNDNSSKPPDPGPGPLPSPQPTGPGVRPTSPQFPSPTLAPPGGEATPAATGTPVPSSTPRPNMSPTIRVLPSVTLWFTSTPIPTLPTAELTPTRTPTPSPLPTSTLQPSETPQPSSTSTEPPPPTNTPEPTPTNTQHTPPGQTRRPPTKTPVPSATP